MLCVCGQENPEDSKFCIVCGGSFSAAAASSAQVQAQAAAASASGAASAVVSSPQPEVSARAAHEAREPVTPSAPSKVSITRWIVIAVLVVFGGAAYYWFNRPLPDYKFKSSGLYFVAENGKTGFIDATGKLVIPQTYDSAEDFSEGLAAVSSHGKYGYIDTHGVLKIQYQFDYAAKFANGVAAVKLCCGAQKTANDQWGFIDSNGKYLINPQFNDVLMFNEDMAAVQIGDLWGYIDKSGKTVIPVRFNAALPFAEGLAAVNDNGRSGYIDKSGKFAINPQFEDARSFSEGLAAVRTGNKYGYIDRSGKYSINPQFSFARDFTDGTAIVSVGDKPALIDKNGVFVINPGQYLSMSGPVDGQIGAQTANGAGIIDTKGNWILTPNAILSYVQPAGGGVAHAQIMNNWCVIDKNGNVIYGRYKGGSLSAIATGIESEKQAVATLRTLRAIQLSYASTYPTVGFADQMSKLGPPPNGESSNESHAGLIDADLASGKQGGYQFSIKAEPQDGLVARYSVVASPTNFPQGNTYCTDESGAVRYASTGQSCNATSPLMTQ